MSITRTLSQENSSFNCRLEILYGQENLKVYKIEWTKIGLPTWYVNCSEEVPDNITNSQDQSYPSHKFRVFDVPSFRDRGEIVKIFEVSL